MLSEGKKKNKHRIVTGWANSNEITSIPLKSSENRSGNRSLILEEKFTDL